MSGEFGEFHVSGYIDEQVRSVTRSCEDGGHHITKEWAKVFRSLVQVAEDIAYAEACDSSEADCILDSFKHVDTVKAALADVETYLSTFKDVLKETIFRKEHGL